MDDRRVHAAFNGMEVVRYDRAGKWYLEHTDGTPRTALPFGAAVGYGVLARGRGRVFFGLPGGSRFDAEVRRAA